MRVGIIGGGFGLRVQAPLIRLHPEMEVRSRMGTGTKPCLIEFQVRNPIHRFSLSLCVPLL